MQSLLLRVFFHAFHASLSFSILTSLQSSLSTTASTLLACGPFKPLDLTAYSLGSTENSIIRKYPMIYHVSGVFLVLRLRGGQEVGGESRKRKNRDDSSCTGSTTGKINRSKRRYIQSKVSQHGGEWVPNSGIYV